jgi:hypothetical protein
MWGRMIWGRTMGRHSLLALCIVMLAACISVGARAQTDKPIDFKPLVPPIIPMLPNSQMQSGSVGGTQDPYTTAPLRSPPQAPVQQAPGMRLTIPRP